MAGRLGLSCLQEEHGLGVKENSPERKYYDPRQKEQGTAQ
jgi:hypothetical protein